MDPLEPMDPVKLMMRRMEALKASCIDYSRTKKPHASIDWSYQKKLYYGHNIFPGVFNQGNRGVCQFCAVTSAGQMELNAKTAKFHRSECRIRFVWESLVTRFLELHGYKPEDGEEMRKTMEKNLITEHKSMYDKDDAIPWCFKWLGVNAKVADKEAVAHDPPVTDCGDKKMTATKMCKGLLTMTDVDMKKYEKSPLMEKNRTTLNLAIEDYKFYEYLTEKQVEKYLKDGRAIVIGVCAGQDFDYLKGDEIYAWIPYYCTERQEWTDKAAGHAVVLIGNGNTGREMNGEQYQPFLNSYGDKYADDGVGCHFYKAILSDFLLLEMPSRLKHVSTKMSDLPDDFPRPKLTQIKLSPPPSPVTSSSSPDLPAVTNPAPHVRPPSPPRPERSSTDAPVARYVPPHSRDRKLSREGGTRANINRARW